MKTSAVSVAPSEWHQLDWTRINGTVRRLQARMVKATQAGDWRRVQALQRFLARSFSGKALAVRRVTENQGSRTPGVDDITWSLQRRSGKLSSRSNDVAINHVR